MADTCRCVSCILPPHMLKKLLESQNDEIRRAALATLLTTQRLRGERAVRSAFLGAVSSPSGGRRTIYDCGRGTNLASAQLVRSEGGAKSSDASVNRAFEGLGFTRDFYAKNFDRNSIDGRGMRLDGFVHRGIGYNNAFWNGQEMVFGDGDGILFTDFTASLDVIAHELTHGVTEFSAGLEYSNQSGALNESISDVFGSLVKQWAKGEATAQADWLIGAEVFTPAVNADALRSMKAPGTAYSHPDLGQDPQPDHMTRYVDLPNTDDGDWGGVHINSGIPNKAFYLTAIGIGGYAWEAPGHIWYQALCASSPNTQFQEFADTTYMKAGQLYGAGSMAQKAVLDAWGGVGIRISGPVSLSAYGEKITDERSLSLEELAARIETLSEQVRSIAGKAGRSNKAS